MPPSGPHLGTESRRMTRTGKPLAWAVLRTSLSMVRWPKRNLLLSRPMRWLRPPARMQISQVADGGLGAFMPLLEREHLLDLVFAADDERGALVHRGGLLVEDTLLAVGGEA